MSDKMEFKAEVNKLLDIVINSIYSEKQIFLRELISNASDACDKLKYLALMNPDLAQSAANMRIVLTPDAEHNTLKITDNGIGMNKDDLINHLGTIAKSGTADFVNNVKDNGSDVDLIGKFGVGFYSAFMVADKVEILTRKAGENAAWKWVSDGIGGFEIDEAQKENNGTEITIFLKEAEKQYTDTIYLRQIVRLYSDHINYPIVLNLGEKGGEEVINTGSALWAKNKAEITKEQYNEFYHHVSKNFDEPWMTLHFKAEGNIEYTGLLFIPETQPYDLFQPDRKNGLKLYVNKVFISDKVEELLPNYLRFVKGVVDSSDLPLNISREMLQQNPMIAKIRSGIVSRILKELKKRRDNYDDYMKFWTAFGTAFKEGIYEDFSNREEIAALSYFNSALNQEKLISLDDYVASMKEGQKAIYYITGDDVKILANNPQLEAFKAKGIDVLLLVDPIDEFWTQVLTTYKDKAIKHISQAEETFDIERSQSQKAKDDNLKKLTDYMAQVLNGEIAKVTTTDKLTNSPVSLTVENGQMSIHLERLMRNHQQQTAFSSLRILEVNPYHPLIIKLSEAVLDDNLKMKVSDMIKILYDQALIAEGEAIKNPSFFAEKLSEYLLAAV